MTRPGRPSTLYGFAIDVPPAMPGVLCETCRSAIVEHAGAAYCSRACEVMDQALTAHAATLIEGDPASIVATRTRLRAVAAVYDVRNGVDPDPIGWYEDIGAGLLADIAYRDALRLARLDMGR